MSIRVDELMPCLVSKRWPWPRACHMFADDGDTEALHSFARSIGLRREWFQDKPHLPHYDLTVSMRGRALAQGATAATREEVVAVMRRNRPGLFARLESSVEAAS